jgi:hypothetical protein
MRGRHSDLAEAAGSLILLRPMSRYLLARDKGEIDMIRRRYHVTTACWYHPRFQIGS